MVLAEAGWGGQGEAAAPPGSLPFFPWLSPSHSPAPCVMEAWARQVLSFLIGEVGGRGGRIKSRLLCLLQMTSPQLFTTTHCIHVRLEFWTSAASGLHPRSPLHTHALGPPLLSQRSLSVLQAQAGGVGWCWCRGGKSTGFGSRSGSVPDILVNLHPSDLSFPFCRVGISIF